MDLEETQEEHEDTAEAPSWEANFVARMIKLRSAKMSQTELARQLSARGLPFHQQTVQRVEKGERPLRLNEAYSIAEILGTDINEMARTIPDYEKGLHKESGQLQHVSGLIADQGLMMKGLWDMSRHRLRSAVRALESTEADPDLQRVVESAHQLLADTDEIDGPLIAAYQMLAKVITGRDNSLVNTTKFDDVTRQQVAIMTVPWTSVTLEEYRDRQR